MINDAPTNVLKDAEQKLESQLTPPVRAAYDKIVVAGLKVAMHNGPNSIAASLQKSKNPIQDIVTGAINIVGLLGRQSRGTMPIKAAVPAAMTLVIHGIDFAEKAKIINGGQEDLVQAAKLFSAQITSHFGISRKMLGTAAQNIQKITQDPVNMEKLKRASGMVKDPRASVPTELPTEQPEPEAAE